VANDISETTASFVEQHSWEFPGLVIEDVRRSIPPGSSGGAARRPAVRGGSPDRRGRQRWKIAAPTARAILQYLMGEDVDTIRSGEDTD